MSTPTQPWVWKPGFAINWLGVFLPTTLNVCGKQVPFEAAFLALWEAKAGRLTQLVLPLATEGQGPFYVKQDVTTYPVLFAIGFDHAYTYSSCTKQWKVV
jgi:hypothetical protein